MAAAAAPPSPSITFYFGLKSPEARAEAAFYAVHNPASRSYRRFPTLSQISRRYGASRATRDAAHGDLAVSQRVQASRAYPDKTGWPAIGDAMPDDHAHATDDTRNLRARFPRWGILFDPLESVWVAVRGKRTLVVASTPEKLTEQVEAAARGETGLDEGDKTQTWRTFRNRGRG